MSNLPVGWGNRLNAALPTNEGTVVGEKTGDWSSHGMPAKYAKESKEAPDNLPFGFGDRSNAKTIEELSLDRSATNVAIAEVIMKDQPHSLLRSADKLDEAKREATRALQAREAAALSAPSPPPAVTAVSGSSSSNSSEAVLNMLASAVLKMDQRMERMEQSIQLVLQQQQQILLERQNSASLGVK